MATLKTEQVYPVFTGGVIESVCGSVCHERLKGKE